MANKEIYIDGVDVSGCKFYQIEANELYPKANYCGSMRNTFCEIEPNCYYKQLKQAENQIVDLNKMVKAKEQECEELNNDNHTLLVTRQKLLNDLWIAEESLKDYKAHYERQCDKLDQLKTENETLFKAIEEVNKINKRLKAENEELNNAYTRLNSLYNDNCNFTGKLEQIITEIKEIATKIIEDYDGNQATNMQEDAKEILQKISECEGNDGL